MSALLKMQGMVKSFPGVRALKGVDLELRAGEVLALLGENGAGKSTLIKILAGAQPADKGQILLDGEPVEISSPKDAVGLGISVIYQEFNLIPGLTVTENIFLGREESRRGWVRQGIERQRAREVIDQLGVKLVPGVRCRDLTIAQQQLVEIARALSLDCRILVMDEPTAALTNEETDNLFKTVDDLRKQGIGIIYVSHRMNEIFRLCDRALVMRDGEYIGTRNVAETSREELIEMMVGRKLENEFPKVHAEQGEERLAVRNLNRGRAVRDVSFSVRRGEVLALTGLVGSGRTETARLIFGADRPDSGTIELDGKPMKNLSPRAAIRAGISLLTEDRKSQGLVLNQTVRDNFGLPNLEQLSAFGFVRRKKERRDFAEYVESLRIKISSQEQLARNLSGGNQQKVVLAKWLESNAKVIIFDEPTRGIDIGAKNEIYLLINRLAGQGKAILLITSELPEAIGMADRILVMHEGRITGEIGKPAKTTQEEIMKLAVG